MCVCVCCWRESWRAQQGDQEDLKRQADSERHERRRNAGKAKRGRAEMLGLKGQTCVICLTSRKLSPPTAKSWAGGGSYSKWGERAFELNGESIVSVMTTWSLSKKCQHHRLWIVPAVLTPTTDIPAVAAGQLLLILQASACPWGHPWGSISDHPET